jgi:hypothetical protein
MTRQIWIIGTVIVIAATSTYYLWLSLDPSRVSDKMRRLPIGRTQSRLRVSALAAYAIGAFIAVQYVLGLGIY